MIPEVCPKCKASMQGGEIPKQLRESGAYGNKTHWSRVIGITDTRLDRITVWQCPDCKHEWPRQG